MAPGLLSNVDQFWGFDYSTLKHDVSWFSVFAHPYAISLAKESSKPNDISDLEDPAVLELLLCLLEVDGNIYFLLLTTYGS